MNKGESKVLYSARKGTEQHLAATLEGLQVEQFGDIQPRHLISTPAWQALTTSGDFRGKFETQVHARPHMGVTAKPVTISPDHITKLVFPNLAKMSRTER